jgi:predicted unusual protein kinase regulating ubiquinone biosynthesis (AarF/ABC1/UbiB family)
MENRDGSQIGQLFRGLVEASSKFGASLPWELSELGVTLVKLDSVSAMLDSRFDSNSFISRVVSQIMQRHMSSALSPAHIFHTVVDTSEFIENLPSRISQILDAVAHNKLKMTVRAIDEKVLIEGFQKIANRITVGLILAALIMGASLLMRVPNKFTIFGYPGLAVICFIAAAGFGFVLVLEVLIGDRKKV